jgi:hypothetical protein
MLCVCALWPIICVAGPQCSKERGLTKGRPTAVHLRVDLDFLGRVWTCVGCWHAAAKKEE